MIEKEWKNRIEIWLDEIQKDFYFTLGTVECDGFTTTEMLSPEIAMIGSFSPMPDGTNWGRKWEYGWFRTKIQIPDKAQGKRVVFLPGMGGEMLVWVNGKLAGSKDLRHTNITLTRCAAAGEIFEILIESYAGHGLRLENGGPYPPGRIPVPEPSEFQLQVGPSIFAEWNEEAYQLYLDAYTLHKLFSGLPPHSLRVQKVEKALKEFTLQVDFEQSAENRKQNYRAARKLLKPLLSCVNGSTAPLFTIFGQSHLDLVWKWPFEETKRKCARTFSSQLALMDEYPECRFLMCEPPILDTIREYYPELYKHVRDKIANGQIIPEGGFYVECDTNIPSGESLIRQFTYGKRWFRSECNYESKMAWLPDSFGFSAALPQIMAGCGIRYFATQKLLRCLPECDPFPYNIFMWEGMDGTQILSHIFMENNSAIDPQILITRWEKDRNQQEDIDTFLFPFGYGDGGGGPTRDIYELASRVKDLEGAPRTRMDTPISFFENIEKNGLPAKRYVGELYLQWHRGTYTSLAKLKKGCRQCEVALHDAEFWSTVANKRALLDYPAKELDALWKKLLFDQFHDLLSGTSITRVNQEGERDFAGILAGARKLADCALAAFVRSETDENYGGLVLFNSLLWERITLIRLPEGTMGAKNFDGNKLPSQAEQDGVYVQVKIPACGYTTIFPHFQTHTEEPVTAAGNSTVSFDGKNTMLENEYLRVDINAVGQITSIFDKESGMQLAGGLCNNFKMYKDVNIDYDAWEIGSMYESLPVELPEQAEISQINGSKAVESSGTGACGGLLAGILVKRKLHNSQVTQRITLVSGSRRVDFHTVINWREQHKLLKVEFPVNVYADEAYHEIQFGYVKRPTHQSRRYDADRYEVSNHRYTALAEAGRGFAVLNDCKYGVNVNGNSINLTLLKAPVIPDMYADQGDQEFTYSIFAYNGTFADSGVTQSGYELNFPALMVKGALGRGSLFTITQGEPQIFAFNNVILETIKEADDGSGDIILRLYESQKTAAKCILHSLFHLEAAYQTDMKEENAVPLNTDGYSLELSFRPFEVKTIRLNVIR